MAAILRSHREKMDKDAFSDWHVAPRIPQKQLAKALSSFAHLAPDETPIAMVDVELRFTGRHGVVLSDRGIHLEPWTGRNPLNLVDRFYGNPRFVSYEDLVDLSILNDTLLGLEVRNGQRYFVFGRHGDTRVLKCVAGAVDDIRAYVAYPTGGPGTGLDFEPVGGSEGADYELPPPFRARVLLGAGLAFALAITAARWYSSPGIRYPFIILSVLIGVSLFISGLRRMGRSLGEPVGGGSKTWVVATAVIVTFAVILGQNWVPEASSTSASSMPGTAADSPTAAETPPASAETNRSGTTSINYSEALDDAESAAAVLALVSSRPGYDAYAVTYDDFAGDYPQALRYVFSSDTITFTFRESDGTPASSTWQGHGIERLTRGASGGPLDD
jgi:hypothetical protein